MWGQNAHAFEDLEIDDDCLKKFDRRMKNAREHVWSRWTGEYVKSLMEQHGMKRVDAVIPKIGQIVLIVG